MAGIGSSGDRQTAAAGAAAFRQAIEQRDTAALLQTLAPDVVFHSPIVHAPYDGRDAVASVLRAVLHVFADFRYVAEYSAPNGHVLQFQTRVGERQLEGVDILTFDDAGLVREFTVMVRPYSAATALRETMAARLASTE
jgi:SnoaL-like domain